MNFHFRKTRKKLLGTECLVTMEDAALTQSYVLSKTFDQDVLRIGINSSSHQLFSCTYLHLNFDLDLISFFSFTPYIYIYIYINNFDHILQYIYMYI